METESSVEKEPSKFPLVLRNFAELLVFKKETILDTVQPIFKQLGTVDIKTVPLQGNFSGAPNLIN